MTMDNSSMVNSMAAGLGHTSMAGGLGHTSLSNSLASSFTNTNSMSSGFPNTSNSMSSGFPNTSNSMSSGFSNTSNSMSSGFPNTSNSMSSGFPNTSMTSALGNSNSMFSGFSNTTMASALSSTNNMGSGLANSNNMASGFGQKYTVDQMSWNSQFGISRKTASELSPGSRKALAGLPNSAGQSMQQSQGQQAFNIQLPKTRKSVPSRSHQKNNKRGSSVNGVSRIEFAATLQFRAGFFGEEEDNETSMYFPGSSNIFRPEKDMLNQSQSPSQPSGFGNNFYSQGGLNSFSVQQQQRGPVSGNQFQRSNALTPTSLNSSFTPGGIAQNSPNRGVISAIGQHRMISSTNTSQSGMSGMQKRPIGSGLSGSATAPISNLSSAFGFMSRGDSSQPNFDISDFPSLGNRVASSSSLSANRNYVGMVSKNPVQDQTPEFQIQQEDFPALPGAQSTLSIFVSDPSSAGNSDPSKKQPMNLISGSSSYEQALNKDGKFVDKVGSGVTRKGIQVHQDGRVTNIPQGMVADQFGIVGLLTFIKSAETDPSLVALAPGMDLTTLGLNLNSPDNLYSTFQSPWVDLPCRPQDIDFHVPAEYLTNIYIRDKLAPIKLNRYGEDLLFFLFYMNGGDVLQLAAAAELYNRDWRYHKEERVWITRAPGVEPIVKTNTYERGTYYFFDAQNWRKVAKEFHLEYDKLEERPSLPPTLHHNTNQPIAAH